MGAHCAVIHSYYNVTVSTSKCIVTSTTTAAAVKEKNKVVKSEKLVFKALAACLCQYSQ